MVLLTVAQILGLLRGLPDPINCTWMPQSTLFKAHLAAVAQVIIPAVPKAQALKNGNHSLHIHQSQTGLGSKMNSFLIVQAKCTRYRAVKVLHTCHCY
ncbi:hypothetical protein AVDCRST_MAG94-4381 [uncultured Leptolyngbya sp.]|uniref:Uncharacterized protein n=1 Tax=uncultured Leptolyngbya sp. TaxID=332963 RepID=A0A6J4N0L7_9CYAN|nr:hypothetical protein AVDCRST_MAG94-4381 [uncultured Leptolyngbya sp.]